MTNTDIQEMEQVREHLQLMLQNCKGFNDHQGDYELAPSTTTAGEVIKSSKICDYCLSKNKN